MSTLTNATAIVNAVKAEPGKTAHYYGQHYGTPCRWNWVYAAFERATRNGLIKADVRKAKNGAAWFTTYTPAA